MDLLIRLLRVISSSGIVMMISRAAGTTTLVLTMAIIASLIVIGSALVEVLLVTSAWCTVSRRTAVLVTKAAVFRRGRVVMAGPIAF